MRSTIKHGRFSLLVATFALHSIGVLTPTANAANIWDGGGVDGFWNTANNWDNDTVPAASQNLTFSGNVQTITTNNIASFIVGTGVASTYAITFANNSTNATSGFTLAGSSIVLGGDISTAASGSAITDTISLAMQMSGNRTVNTGANHNLIISGLVGQTSASRQLVKAGTGELILRNAGNNFLGSTTVNAGTLTIDVLGGIQNAGSASALGAGTGANSQIFFSGGTLNVTLGAGSTDRQVRIGNTTGTSTGGAAINNNSANGSNPLLFSNAAFNVSAGTITVNRLLSLGGANTDANAINGAITDNNTAGGGTVSLTKSGVGRWILSGANTYTGATTISAGTLQLGDGTTGKDGTVASSGIVNNGSLVFNRFGSSSYGGVISGTGSVTKSGEGIQTLSGANNYTGGTTLNAGTLQLGNDTAAGTGTLALNGGVISSSSSTGRSLLNATTIGGNVILGDAVNNGSLTFNAALNLGGVTRTLTTASDVTLAGIVSNGSLNKAGAGTLLLTAANSYTGATTISAGTLQLGNGTAGNDGTLASSSIVNNSSLLFNRSGSSSYDGVISGSGNVTKSGAGTQTLSGSNTYTGNTAVRAGTLQLATNGSLRFVIGGNETNNAVTGTGTTTMNGQFVFDLTGASTNTNSTWTIVAAPLTNSYGANFLVNGFTGAGGNWTNTTNGVRYVFSQSLGTLSVQATNNSTPVAPFQAWIELWKAINPGFIQTAGTDDPDGDGYNNNMEFAFGGNPTVGSSSVLSTALVGSDVVISYVAMTTPNAVTYQVQSTTDLSTGGWSNLNVTIRKSVNQEGISQPSIYERREFSVPVTTKGFYRVQATILP